jgi:hypothetical protein
VQVEVVVVAEDELVRDVQRRQHVLLLGVAVHDLTAGVLDDVVDLGGGQPEVDRDQDASVPGDAEERREQAGGVLRDEGHPAADGHAELVELRGLRAGVLVELPVRQPAEAGRRLVRLVDDGDPVAVDVCRAVEEVANRQRVVQDTPPGRRRPIRTFNRRRPGGEIGLSLDPCIGRLDDLAFA